MLHSKVRKERVTELHPVHTKTAARARLIASLASDVSNRQVERSSGQRKEGISYILQDQF